MNTEKERAEFEAVFSVPPDVIWNEEHQHYGWVSHPRHDAPFNLQWEAWQAARAPQLEEIEGLREALVVFANKSNWLETLDVNAEVITWEHELIGEPWKFAQKAISDSLGDIESRIDAINERSRLRVENEELRAQVERLREAAGDLIGVIDLDSTIDPDHLLVRAARATISETPRQSLVYVQADAVEGAARELSELLLDTDKMALVEHAKQLREQSND